MRLTSPIAVLIVFLTLLLFIFAFGNVGSETAEKKTNALKVRENDGTHKTLPRQTPALLGPKQPVAVSDNGLAGSARRHKHGVTTATPLPSFPDDAADQAAIVDEMQGIDAVRSDGADEDVDLGGDQDEDRAMGFATESQPLLTSDHRQAVTTVDLDEANSHTTAQHRAATELTTVKATNLFITPTTAVSPKQATSAFTPTQHRYQMPSTSSTQPAATTAMPSAISDEGTSQPHKDTNRQHHDEKEKEDSKEESEDGVEDDADDVLLFLNAVGDDEIRLGGEKRKNKHNKKNQSASPSLSIGEEAAAEALAAGKASGKSNDDGEDFMMGGGQNRRGEEANADRTAGGSAVEANSSAHLLAITVAINAPAADATNATAVASPPNANQSSVLRSDVAHHSSSPAKAPLTDRVMKRNPLEDTRRYFLPEGRVRRHNKPDFVVAHTEADQKGKETIEGRGKINENDSSSSSTVAPVPFAHWQFLTNRFLGVTRQDALMSPLLCADVMGMLAAEEAADEDDDADTDTGEVTSLLETPIPAFGALPVANRDWPFQTATEASTARKWLAEQQSPSSSHHSVSSSHNKDNNDNKLRRLRRRVRDHYRDKWRKERLSCDWYRVEAYPVRSPDVLLSTFVFPFPHPSGLNVRGALEVHHKRAVAALRQQQQQQPGATAPVPSPYDLYREAAKPTILGAHRLTYVLAAITNSFAFQAGDGQLSGGVDRAALWYGKYGAFAQSRGLAINAVNEQALMKQIGLARVPFNGIHPLLQRRVSVPTIVAMLKADEAAERQWALLVASSTFASSAALKNKSSNRTQDNSTVAGMPSSAPTPPPAPVANGPALYFSRRQAQLIRGTLARFFAPSVAFGPAPRAPPPPHPLHLHLHLFHSDNASQTQSSDTAPTTPTTTTTEMSSAANASSTLSPSPPSPPPPTPASPAPAATTRVMSLHSVATTPFVLVESNRAEWVGLLQRTQHRLMRSVDRISAADVMEEAAYHHQQQQRRKKGGGEDLDATSPPPPPPSSLPLRVPLPDEIASLSPYSPMLVHLLSHEMLAYHHDRREPVLMSHAHHRIVEEEDAAAIAARMMMMTGGDKGGENDEWEEDGWDEVKNAFFYRRGVASSTPIIWPPEKGAVRGGGKAKQWIFRASREGVLGRGNGMSSEVRSSTRQHHIVIGGRPFEAMTEGHVGDAGSLLSNLTAAAEQQLLSSLLTAEETRAPLNLWTQTELSFMASHIASSTRGDAAAHPSQAVLSTPKEALIHELIIEMLTAERSNRNMYARYKAMGEAVDAYRRFMARQQDSTAVMNQTREEAAQRQKVVASAIAAHHQAFPFAPRLPPQSHKLSTVANFAIAMRNRLVRLSPSASPFFESALEDAMVSVSMEVFANSSARGGVDNDDTITGVPPPSAPSPSPPPILGMLTHAPPHIKAAHVDAISGHWNMSDLPPWLTIPATVNVAHCLDPLNHKLKGNKREGGLKRGGGGGDYDGDQFAKYRYQPGDDLFQPKNSILIIGSSHGRNLYTSLCTMYAHARAKEGEFIYRRHTSNSGGPEGGGGEGDGMMFKTADIERLCAFDRTKERFASISREAVMPTLPVDDPYRILTSLNASHSATTTSGEQRDEAPTIGGARPRRLRGNTTDTDSNGALLSETAPIPLAFFMDPFYHFYDVEQTAISVKLRLEEIKAEQRRRVKAHEQATAAAAASDSFTSPPHTSNNHANHTSRMGDCRSDADENVRDLAGTFPNFVARASRRPQENHLKGKKTKVPFGFSEFFTRSRSGDYDAVKGIFSHIVFVPGVWEATYFDNTISEHAENTAIVLDMLEEVFRPTKKIILYNIHAHQYPVTSDPTGNHNRVLAETMPQFVGYDFNASIHRNPADAGVGGSSRPKDAHDPFDVEGITRTPQLCGHAHRFAKFRDAQLSAASPVTRARVRAAWRSTFEAMLSRGAVEERTRTDGALGSDADSLPLVENEEKSITEDLLTRRVPVEVIDHLPALSQGFVSLFADASGHHYVDVALEAMAMRLLRDHVCPPQFVMAVRPSFQSRSNSHHTAATQSMSPLASLVRRAQLSASEVSVTQSRADVLRRRHTHLYSTATLPPPPLDKNPSLAASQPFHTVDYANSPLPSRFPLFEKDEKSDEESNSVDYYFIRVSQDGESARRMPTLEINDATTGASSVASVHQPVITIRNLFPLTKSPLPTVEEGLYRAIFDHPFAEVTRSDRAVRRRKGAVMEARKDVRSIGGNSGGGSGDYLGTLDQYNPFTQAPMCSCLRARRLVEAKPSTMTVEGAGEDEDGSGSGNIARRLMVAANSDAFLSKQFEHTIRAHVIKEEDRARRQWWEEDRARRQWWEEQMHASFTSKTSEEEEGDEEENRTNSFITIRSALTRNALNPSLATVRAHTNLLSIPSPTNPQPMLTTRVFASRRFNNDVRYLLRTASIVDSCAVDEAVDKERQWLVKNENATSEEAYQEIAVCRGFRSKPFPCSVNVVEELRRRMNTFAFIFGQNACTL